MGFSCKAMKQFLLQPKTALYVCGFLFAAQLALTGYLNSSFLAGFVGSSHVGLIYSIGAILSIVSVLVMPRVLGRFGLYRFVVFFLALNALASSNLAHATTTGYAISYFVIWFVSNSLIALSFDELLEHYSDDKMTGSIRGSYLTIMNFAWLLSPLASGFIFSKGGYTGLYTFISIIVAVICLIALIRFRGFHDPTYERASIKSTLTKISEHPGLRRIFAANLILQGFYATMVVYSPIYLHTHLGFEWKTLGIIFTIMLLPFVLFELPLGRLADRIGERKILIAGFLIGAAATVAVGIVGGVPAAMWALILFLTRTGASAIEIMTESFFFKSVGSQNPGIISMFRTLSPLAYIVVPVAAAGILRFLPITSLFIIAAVMLLVGAFIARKLANAPQ